MQDGVSDRVDTLQVGAAWVVRVGVTVVGTFTSRLAAVEAGWQLAADTGREHVVHYSAAAVRERLAAAEARRTACGESPLADLGGQRTA